MIKILAIITGAAAILGVVFYITWDIIIATVTKFKVTLSDIIRDAAVAFPFIAFAWGVITAHWFLSKYGLMIFHRLDKIRFYIWIPIAVLFLGSMILALIKKSAYYYFMSNDLIIPWAFGIVLGLMWYQK